MKIVALTSTVSIQSIRLRTQVEADALMRDKPRARERRKVRHEALYGRISCPSASCCSAVVRLSILQDGLATSNALTNVQSIHRSPGLPYPVMGLCKFVLRFAILSRSATNPEYSFR